MNNIMQLFDAHCHLQDQRLLPNLPAVMERAAAAGVSGLMCCGTNESDWTLLPGLSARYPGVRLSFGLHPWYIGGCTGDWLRTLTSALTSFPSAVGEIGLDHALPLETYAEQEEVFLAQIHLANTLGRPVTIHCRRAWGRMMELLDAKGWPAAGFVLHSYSGSIELIQPLTRRGAFFSFSGSITYEANRKGRDAVKAVPPDRLLLETDAPDIAPQGLSFPLADGKPVNEPANLCRVLETAAELRGLSREHLAEQTWRNAMDLFGV